MKMKHPTQVIVLLFTVGLMALFTHLNTPPTIAPWLIILQMISVIVGVMLSPLIAGMLGFVTLGLWIVARQNSGLWMQAELITTASEISLLTLNLLLAIRYRRLWLSEQKAIGEIRGVYDLLHAGEIGTGLLPYEIGELRLHEEVDRAAYFGRPVALLLIEMLPLQVTTPTAMLAKSQTSIVQALTANLSLHDTPFRQSETRIAVILPERDWQELYIQADQLEYALRAAMVEERSGYFVPISHYLTLNFGLSVLEGGHQSLTRLIEKAENALHVHTHLVEALADYDTLLTRPNFEFTYEVSDR